MTAIEYHLTHSAWQLFGTFTWADKWMGTSRKRENAVDEFLRKRCTRAGVSLSDLPLVIRWERGEVNQRPHCHWLIDGLPQRLVTRNECHTWNALWFHLWGLARVRLYCPSLRAQMARYMLDDDPALLRPSSVHEANSYERSKFGRADSVVINDAAWNRWQREHGVSFSVLRCT